MNAIGELLLTATSNKAGEQYLYGVNGRLFFNVDSKTIFADRFNKEFLKENSLYIVAGTDSGLFVDFIARQSIPSGAKVVFLDFAEIIEWVRQHRKVTLPRGIHLLTFEEFKESLQALDASKYIFLNTLNYIPSFSVTDGHHEVYVLLGKEVEAYLQNLHWETTIQVSNHLFLVNQFKNIADNTTHASCFFGRFKGQDALLLAGGPSLDSCISWIQAHQNECIVIAVSRISRQLLNVGITPDFIFSVDPQEISLDLSREMFHFDGKSVFIHSYHAFPPMVAQWLGKKAYLGPLFPWSSPLNGVDRASGGATVTNTALACALEMGFARIVLCGVDLCYSSEGHTHASFSKNRDHGPVVEGETRIETNAGAYAETTHAYAFAAQHIQHLAQSELAEECRIINPNPFAAKMDGVHFQRLEDIDVKGLPHKTSPAILLPPSERETHYAQSLREISAIEGKLKRIRALSGKAIRETRIFFQKKGNSVRTAKKHIDKIETLLHSEDLLGISNLAKSFGIKHFLPIIMTKELDAVTDREAEDNLRQYYLAFIASVKQIATHLAKATEDIALRREENKPSPDWEKLLRYFIDSRIPGRCRLLRQEKTTTAGMSGETDALYTRSVSMFRDYLEGAWSYSKVYDQEWNQWTAVKEHSLVHNLLKLLKEKNTEKIEQIITVLEGSANDAIDPFLQFARGVLAECHQQHAKALSLFNTIIDGVQEMNSFLVEQTLKRVASLSLSIHDIGNGLLALQCLNDLSVEYAPQYAKMLKLTNQPNEALDVYASYVERFPEDTRTMLEMATLYGELSIKEGVLLLTGYILERDPENITARQLRDAHAQ